LVWAAASGSRALKIVNAVLAAPAVLSGLEPEAAERIRALAIEVNHPQETAQIRDLEAAQKVVEQAVEHARERIVKRGNVKPGPDGSGLQSKNTPDRGGRNDKLAGRAPAPLRRCALPQSAYALCTLRHRKLQPMETLGAMLLRVLSSSNGNQM